MMLKIHICARKGKSNMKKINEKEFTISKANDLIQKMSHDLNLQEQKIILYLISKIKPEDTEFQKYEITIKEFCNLCNIKKGGKTYKEIRTSIKKMADKSFWAIRKEEPETEILLRWLNEVKINKNTLQIELSRNLRPYLLELTQKFTAYKLKNILQLKSQYSINMYELLKSYERAKSATFKIERLKALLNAETYKRYPDFRVRVIDTALKEINEYTDIQVTYTTAKTSRKITEINFYIIPKLFEEPDVIEVFQVNEDKTETKIEDIVLNTFEKVNVIKLNAPECHKNPQEGTCSVKNVEPSLEEINAYIAKYELSVDVPRFRAYYGAMDWMEKGEPIDWKKKLSTWQDMKTQAYQHKSNDIQGKPTYTTQNLMAAEDIFFLNN